VNLLSDALVRERIGAVDLTLCRGKQRSWTRTITSGLRDPFTRDLNTECEAIFS
jgi:hypothetical protein